MRTSSWAAAGCISAFIGVSLGAFGAHGLKGKLEPVKLEVYEVGVRYQMYHALALVAAGALDLAGRRHRLRHAAGWALAAGTMLFSGSLYVLALGGPRWLGAVTPFGGVSFLAAWLLLALIFFLRGSEVTTK